MSATKNVEDLDHTKTHDSNVAQSTPSWLLNPVQLGVFLIVASAIGLWASYDLSIEKVRKLEDPNLALSCDFNPFFSCGNVMDYWQSQVFGFPNQFIGCAAFIFPLLIGVMLVSKTKIPAWIMVGLNVGLTLGVALVVFLYISSIYVIGVGCPWCIVVWTVTYPMFFAVTGHNVLAGNFGQTVKDSVVCNVLARHSILLACVVLFLIYASIVIEFWTFFGSFI